MRLEPRKSRQCVLELEQRTDVIFLVRHARRFFADLVNGLEKRMFLRLHKVCEFLRTNVGLGWVLGGTHRISWDLTDITKGDVLPAVIDVVSATIRAKVVRSDEDGLGDHRLAPRIGPTRWRGGARGEIEWQEFDAITRLESPKKRKSDFSSSSFFFLSLYGERKKKKGRGRACACY